MKTWRVVGINFDHFHMGDNLAFAQAHPRAEVVGVCDEFPQRVEETVRRLRLPPAAVFTDWRTCLDTLEPDLVVLCPATAERVVWIERVAPYGIPIVLEKPLAATLTEADRVIACARRHHLTLAVNWPLAWYPCHRTAHRLAESGAIGEVVEVHYYDGNRGPLWHTAGKEERTAEAVAREKPTSWFYSREKGGGSLLDYLGYGTTLGTWFLGGRRPLEVTAVADEPQGLEVDEHAVVVARYAFGLSKFETRWGTFTDPWTHQPQPKCGFVLVGTEGTISSYDYESAVRVQDRRHPEGRVVPADAFALSHQNPIAHLIAVLEGETSLDGPMSLPICRIGQEIVDAAVKSVREKRTIPLEPCEGA